MIENKQSNVEREDEAIQRDYHRKGYHYMWDLGHGRVGHIVNYKDTLRRLENLGEMKMEYRPWGFKEGDSLEKPTKEIVDSLKKLPCQAFCNYETKIFSRTPEKITFNIGLGIVIGYDVKGDFSRHRIKKIYGSLIHFLRRGCE